LVLCFLLPMFALAQTKSSNIQTINGKKYYIHKLEKGQSLYSLTKLYGVDLNSIYAENPQAKTGSKAGEEIKIPMIAQQAPVSAPTVTTTVLVTSTASTVIDTNRYKTYKVTKGETLYSLTKKLNLSDKELEKWNPTISQGIKEGQVLVIGEKRKVGNVITSAQSLTVNTTNIDSINPHIMHTKKQSYNVGLFLPFRVDATLATDINYLAQKKLAFPSISSLAVDFYLGFKKAVDSLTMKDMEVNLSLFDVDDKDSGKIETIVKSNEFKQLDMLVGPLYASGFKTVAQSAKQMNVPLISPFTQQTKILYNNSWTSKMTPSQYTLLEGLADYCMDTLKGQLILMNNTKDLKEAAFNKAFKTYYNERLKQVGRPVNDTVFEVRSIAALKVAYKGAKSVVVTLSSNQVFIVDFVTQLAIFAGKKEITLAGWQSTSSLDNLDQEYLNQLKFTFPSQNNITNTEPYAVLISDYRTQMNTYPSEYYFEGYDLGMYYLKQLKENGIDGMQALDKAPVELPYTRFKFVRPDKATGFDNKGMYIFKYDNYKLVKTGWN
jgi:LysM repeat protein/ABC-type branched-subunit amino acid transport system substrate-binding protein